MSTSITQTFGFEAAHQLWDPELDKSANLALYGPCARVHGHSFQLRITIGSATLKHGMVINFTDVSDLVQMEIIDRFDHQILNQVQELHWIITTAECVAQWVFNRLKKPLNHMAVDLLSVELAETADAWATVTATV